MPSIGTSVAPGSGAEPLEQRRYRLLRVELTEYRDQLSAKHGRVAGRHTDGAAVADAIDRMLARAAGLGGPDDG